MIPSPKLIWGVLFMIAALSAAMGQSESRDVAIERTQREINDLVARYGGFETVEKQLAPFQKEVSEKMVRIVEGGRTFLWETNHFNRAITTSGIKNNWVQKGGGDKVDPMDAIVHFDRELKKIGVDLIFVPVPSKIEAYAHQFETPLEKGIPISPGRTKAMLQLLEQNVEVVDILPTLMAARGDDAIPVYETSGHHPSGLGAKLAGELVAQRLARYSLTGRDLQRFQSIKRTATERINRKVPMTAWTVVDQNKQPYEHVNESQVVVIGDSHAFAYGTASWACHIARATGIPITDLSTSSGGSTAPQRLANLGMESLKNRKAVVWIITSTHLERFPWDLPKLVEAPSLAGLITLGKMDQAFDQYKKIKQTNPEAVDLNEGELNNLGYQLLGTGNFDQAIAVFKLNTMEFPNSGNAFDSLGEAYKKAGKNTEAIACFKKSLSLFPPENTVKNSLTLLAELGVEATPPPRPKLTEAAMDNLLGTYSVGPTMTATVKREGESLFFHMLGRPAMEMLPVNDTFFTSDPGIRFQFLPATESMTLEVVFRGNRITATRVSGAGQP